jgi:hypothetical protein
MGQMRNITLSGRHHLKELGRDGRITFKWNLKDQDMDCIHLAQDRNNFWAFVNLRSSRLVIP